MKRNLSFVVFLMLIGYVAQAQRIVYSEPDRDDSRRLDFEVVGKVSGNFLIYKNSRNKSWISVLDNDMKQISKVEQDYVPDNDRIINTDFFPYGNYAYMIYQYQKRNVVYCMAALIGGDGKLVGDVKQLDTTHIGFAADNKIYTVLNSEDKSKFSVFKINSRNKKLYLMTTMLFDKELILLKKSSLQIPMEDRHDYVSEFNLDNEGDLIFCKFIRNNNDNINSAFFVVKHADSDTLMYQKLNLEKTLLDEIHIKVDNPNHRYILTSFYFQERRGNIDGLYLYVWDKKSFQPVLEKITIFSDELKKEARGDAGLRMAFNDYFIRDIVSSRDGGFIMGTEAYYTTSRFNNWNRWDYLYGSPFSNSFYNDYYYSPLYNRYGYGWGGRSNQNVRYHADNITIFSFDASGELKWSRVISKSQYNDETDDDISYQLMNTGGELKFLFNQPERRNNFLTDYSLSPGGEIVRNPTLKNLDKGYEFLPKYGKQVSSKQMIVPCLYRNYICFAKIEYN